jgi:hypothetical protein
LASECRGNGGRGCREGCLARIPDGLEQHASMSLDCGAQELKVAFDRSGHRRSVLLPELGTPFDIGEEEGDGAARQVGHRPSPYLALGGTIS